MYEVPLLEKKDIKGMSDNGSVLPVLSNVSNLYGGGVKAVSSLLRTLKGSSKDVETEGRFLNLFEVVNFNNVECVSGTGVSGVCMHEIECASGSGVQVGSCADGFGVCCKFQYTCGEQTSSNCSTFTNPGFPSSTEDRLSCTLTIHKASLEVKQLRLSFVLMELQPPRNGTCVDDQFVITGQNVNNVVPIICGINNGQHMYVEVGEASGPYYVSVLSPSRATRLFQIEVCQIQPESISAAPAGCLQYHTEPEGVLESFNYQLQSKGIPLIPPNQAGAEIFNCPDDFMVVNGIRLCGERLNDASITEDFTVNAPVTEMGSGPISFVFRTNGNVTGRGFHLLYKQNKCFTSRNDK
ncbi:uncharacterized protein LOC143921689 [Arctopsyche grandis]|uniref:uncharacterized protein LOC143921689 n=1 Tax=Arctopsyche grandis TaxID=121162 RepID=UPI00406D9159